MGKFEKHIGKGEKVEIGGDEFILKPLSTEHMPLFLKAMKAFSGATEDGKTEDMFKNLDDEAMIAIKDMIEITLFKSYPDEDKEQMKEFGLKYMMVLLPKIMELNTVQSKDVEKIKKIEAIQRMKNPAK